jgi:hypothetical protein
MTLASAFKSVDDYRLPVLFSAGAHPSNVIPVGGAVVTLVLTGFFLAALAVVAADLAVIMIVLRLKGVRRRVGRSAEREARKRAAQRLAAPEQERWQSLDALAARTESFNPRGREVERLLDTFLNVALAQQYAEQCTLGADVDETRSCEGAIGQIVAERKHAGRRAEHAVSRLRAQLDATAQRIRLACAVAVAEQCEASAELWLPDEHELE